MRRSLLHRWPDVGRCHRSHAFGCVQNRPTALHIPPSAWIG